MLGRSLARRVYGTRAQSNIIARFGTLCLAEAPVIHTEFMGQTLRECGFRERFGLNVAGLWEGNSYMSARRTAGSTRPPSCCSRDGGSA